MNSPRFGSNKYYFVLLFFNLILILTFTFKCIFMQQVCM